MLLQSNAWMGYSTHECVGLTQLAIIAASFNWQVIIPWPFTSHELMVLLADLLPCDALQRISMALMTRNFHLLWEDSELLGMLGTRCLICQEPVDLNHLQAHLVVQHQITADKLKYVTHQLSVVYANLSLAEERCDWCNELLPSYLNSEDEMCVDPHAHLQKCPMITQMAMLLMHPKWASPALQPLTWASQEQIAETRQRHALKMWQFNVSTPDTFGVSLELTAQCGLQMLEDILIAESITHKCLLCGKAFFIVNQMIKHLHYEHNFLQLQTHMCYHRLTLRCTAPCQFCGIKEHTVQCPVLLNLAVFLVNGYGIRGIGRHRCGQQDLGQSVDEGTDGQFGHCSTSAKRWQKTQDRSQKQTQLRFHNSAEGSSGHAVQTCPEARGHHQQSPSGESVPVTSGTGAGQYPSFDDGCQPILASEGGQNNSTPTSPCPDHDGGTGQKTSEVDGGNSNRSTFPGLQSVSSDTGRQGQDNAVPALEPSAQMFGTNGTARSAHPGGQSQPAEHPENSGSRPEGDPSISQPEKAHLRHGDAASTPVALDGGASKFTRTVARSLQTGLSQFLATCPSASPPTEHGAHPIGQDFDEGHVIHIPTFMNSTGTACFANVVVICIAWLTLLSNGDDPSQWVHGYELLRNVFLAGHIPMDLPKFDPFLWLLLGEWSVESFRIQHDVCEFTTYLLNVMQPQFLHCSWVTMPERLAPGDASMPSEKGSRFTPIQLAYIDHLADSVQLQSLIDLWHNPRGLCRAAEEVGYQLILMIDRFNPETFTKCQQKIEISHNSVRFPYFSGLEGAVIFETFAVCAIIFHLGSSPLSGHYRAALRYNSQWMLYEDGRPPDRVDILPEIVLRNCVMFWCTRPTSFNVRTMETADPRAFRSFGTITPMDGRAEALVDDSQD